MGNLPSTFDVHSSLIEMVVVASDDEIRTSLLCLFILSFLHCLPHFLWGSLKSQWHADYSYLALLHLITYIIAR